MRFVHKPLAILLLVAGTAGPALAREVIGDDEEEEQKKEAPKKKPAEKAPEKAPADKPADKGKAPAGKEAPPAKPADKAAPAKPAEKAAAARPEGDEDKTELQKQKETEAAEEAALKKAEEEARKKREAEEQKKKEATEKRAAQKAEAGKQNLEGARKSRTYRREKSGLMITAKLTPGAVEDNKLTEMEFMVVEKLAEPDPTYGDYGPIEDGELLVTLTCTALPPPKDPKAKTGTPPPPVAYALHPLGDAGKYGFHATLPTPGEWQVKMSGKRKDGKAIPEASIPLHVSVWPPPDFDAEEKNNANLSGAGGGRAVE